MSLTLPRPGDRYDRPTEDRRNRVIEQADQMNHKRGTDIELGQNERIILRSPDGSRWSLSVSNAGALEVTAL